jgi:hypothetical protein
MDFDIYDIPEVVPESPNVLKDDLVSYFNLQKLNKDYKKKKQNRALPIGLKEIVLAEKNKPPPNFSIPLSDKKHFFS